MKFSHKIGIVTWDYERPKGGLGRAMQQFSVALKDLGYDVRTLTPETKHAWTKRFGLHLVFSFALIPSLKSWIRKMNRNLIIFPCGPGGVWMLGKKPRNCKAIAIVYHTYLQQVRSVPGQWWKRIFLPMEKQSLKWADHVFCYAADTKTVLENDYKIPPERVHLLPQILPLRQWLCSSGGKERGLCVCVARLEQRKGALFLLDVWKKLSKTCPKAHLVIVGDGVQAKKIDRMIADYQLSVARVDNLNQQELIALVGQAQILLCPSYLEGFGLVPVEAMAAGTLVIANNVDGLRSLIDNEQTGLLLSVGNSDTWIQAIGDQLAHTEAGEHMTVNARLKVQERFNTDCAIQALQKCLETL